MQKLNVVRPNCMQIAQIFNVSVPDLIESDKGVVFCMNDNSDYIYTSYNGNNEAYNLKLKN